MASHPRIKMVGYQLDDEPNLYHGKMIGNHNFHPLNNCLVFRVPVCFLCVFLTSSEFETHFSTLPIFVGSRSAPKR